MGTTRGGNPGGAGGGGKAAPSPGSGIGRWLFVGLLGALVALGTMVAMDLETLDQPDSGAGVAAGDTLLLDRLSAEFGSVSEGEVVLLRNRGKHAEVVPPLLRRVVAIAGEEHRGHPIERGHILVATAFGKREKGAIVPVGDVLAVVRLRIRSEGESWAVDTLAAADVPAP